MKRSLDVAATVLAALLLLAFAALSLRGLIAPEQASARFGAPVADAAGSLFYRVYLSRNLVIVITGAIFLLTRQWTPLAILLTVTAALPAFDMLLDEPFAGIDPIAVGDIQDLVRHLTNRGIGVLITDHNVRETLGLTDRAYIVYAGQILTEGSPEEIVNDPDVRRLYLGEEFRL